MLHTHIGQLPHHLDCWVEARFVLADPGETQFLPCRWFGLTAIPGRVWGCTVLLESGAVYRDLPPHALAFHEEATPLWQPHKAQRWDCYGWQFSTLIYSALDGLWCEAMCGPGCTLEMGRYLFTAAPVGDAFTHDPRQAKQFMFIRLDNGRLTIQPTDRVIFRDTSFTTHHFGEWPEGLKGSEEAVSCEH